MKHWWARRKGGRADGLTPANVPGQTANDIQAGVEGTAGELFWPYNPNVQAYPAAPQPGEWQPAWQPEPDPLAYDGSAERNVLETALLAPSDATGIGGFLYDDNLLVGSPPIDLPDPELWRQEPFGTGVPVWEPAIVGVDSQLTAGGVVANMPMTQYAIAVQASLQDFIAVDAPNPDLEEVQWPST